MLLLLPACVLLAACSDYRLTGKDTDNDIPIDTDDTNTGGDTEIECQDFDLEPRDVGVTDECEFHIGSFNPVIKFQIGQGKNSTALPVVADLDKDGMPEIITNQTGGLGLGSGSLVVVRGDTGATVWQDTAAELGYGASFAVGDIDVDGEPEVVGIRKHGSFPNVSYTTVAWSATGTVEWESEEFTNDDFDYAAQPAISDMDHDGAVEVVAGRVILNGADGSTRGHGQYGRGSYGLVGPISESAAPAIADLDLDGIEEVIVGDARYSPDGAAVWRSGSQEDAMIGVANLDDDPEGEVVAISFNTVRAVDTDGLIMWGPLELDTANIVSPPAIGDLDGDGRVEIIVAGGNYIVALHDDGSEMWRNSVTDESGATGASIFDFEGDGIPEVVYIDEVEMVAYNGITGEEVFLSTEHTSNTMMDYPVVADVDSDGHAEIVVAHQGYGYAASVYEDLDDSWAPARKVWNQHAYSISNINDDLSVPTTAVPGFSLYNNWHAAIDRTDVDSLIDDVESEIAGTCEDDCDQGVMHVVGRLLNKSNAELPAGIPVSLYAQIGSDRTLLGVQSTTVPTPGGTTGEPMEWDVDASIAADADSLWIVADDLGTGGGVLSECSEDNNDFELEGPFCR